MTKPEQAEKGNMIRSFDDLTRDQIAIYAKELNEHFRKERKLRMSLQDRDGQLEQRAREVTALNHMLQQHLLEWYKVAQEYREVLSAIRDTLRVGAISSDETDELGALIDNFVPTDGASPDTLGVLEAEVH